MTVDEYINSVILNIKSKSARENVEKELRDYITDRTERYIAMGYDEAAATKKTLERMGNGEIPGQQFGKMYGNKRHIIFVILFLITAYALFIVFQGLTIFTWGSSISEITLINEVFVFTLSMLSISLGSKYKSIGLVVASIPVTFVYIIIRICRLSSPMIVTLYFTVTKHLDDLSCLTDLYDNNKADFSFLSVVAFALYGLWITLYCRAISNIKKFNSCNYSLKDCKSSKHIEKYTLIAILAINLILISVALIFSQVVLDSDEYKFYDGIYVVQSDEMCDLKDLDYENNIGCISIDYDWTQRHLSFDNYIVKPSEITGKDFSLYKSYNGVLSYERLLMAGEINPKKRYIAVVPYVDGLIIYEQGNLYDTKKTNIIKGKIPNKEISEFEYELVLSKDLSVGEPNDSR